MTNGTECKIKGVQRDTSLFFFFLNEWSLGTRRSMHAHMLTENLQTVCSAGCACGQFLFLFASLRSKEIDSSDLVRIKGRVRWFREAQPQPPIQMRPYIQP